MEEDSDSDLDDRPRYAFVLEEEDYEEESDVPGQPSLPLQDNFEPEDPTPEIEGWDPRSHEYYFQIQ